jgi:hypothetical protein
LTVLHRLDKLHKADTWALLVHSASLFSSRESVEGERSLKPGGGLHEDEHRVAICDVQGFRDGVASLHPSSFGKHKHSQEFDGDLELHGHIGCRYWTECGSKKAASLLMSRASYRPGHRIRAFPVGE